MKIYQIHEYGGEWEDAYDCIVASYISEEKAIAEKERLEQENEVFIKCKSCPLYYCQDECDNDCEKCNENKVAYTKSYCDRYKGHPNDSETCMNYYYGEIGWYKIEEVEVIE